MNPFLHTLGWALLHFLWEGLLLGLIAGGVLALMQRRSPQARYGVGLGFLILMALAPVLTFLLLRGEAAPVVATAGSVIALPSEASGVASHEWKANLDASLPIVLLVWGIGVTLLSARFAGGLFYLQRLASTGVEPAPAEWHLVLARLSREMGLRRAVRLLRSFRVEAPMVVGWMRPVILIPAAAFSGLSPAQIEAVLAHEMAHIRRLDFLVNLFQSALETLLFFHPAVWWLSSRLRAERELCCDDAAVAICGDRALYARALALLETNREQNREAKPSELGVAATGGALMARIRRLLQPQFTPTPRLRPAAFALVAAGLLAGTVVQQQKPAATESKQIHNWDMERTGEVTLDPTAKHPVMVGKDGSFKVKSTANGTTRSYEVTAKEGEIYKVNGVQCPLDEAGRAWLREAVKRTLPHETRSATRERLRADRERMKAEVIRGEAEEARAEAERVRIEVMKDLPEVTTESKDGKTHLIVRKQGKVVTDEEMPDPPDVTMTDEGPGRKHLVVKKNGQVVEDRIIEVPEVTTVEKDGETHLVVKKNGKVVEDQVLPKPEEDGSEWDEEDGTKDAEIQRLQARIAALEARLEAVRSEKGSAVPPVPPVPPVAPVAPAPPPPPPPAPPED